MRMAALVLCSALAAFAAMPSIPMAKGGSEAALDPMFTVWKSAEPISLALHRTPLLYPTDAPATPEIDIVQLQLLRGAGATFARLEWRDKTGDSIELAKAERVWQTERNVAQSEATNRFPDACAIMIPAQPLPDGLNPSLQMGDAAHPVRIFFWDAIRGAAVMQATGRETTSRTGKSFPVRSGWSGGIWTVTMQLPDLPEGTPLAIAVWNGAQQDRDGRKYFTIWYRTR